MKELDCEGLMIFKETNLRGAFIIEIEKREDERGFFARTVCSKEFLAHGLNSDFVQSNIAFNKRAGTLRGLHYQLHPYEEIKLVRCTRGAIYDVIVDVRSDSATYKKWFGVELTSDNYRMLYVPEGFAHGYQTLADSCEVTYQVSQIFSSESERGIRWNDPTLKILWPMAQPTIISEKDSGWPDVFES